MSVRNGISVAVSSSIGPFCRAFRLARILHYSVSVEKVEEALKAIEYAGIATVQIIFNSPD
jgi:hypothetical protein